MLNNETNLLDNFFLNDSVIPISTSEVQDLCLGFHLHALFVYMHYSFTCTIRLHALFVYMHYSFTCTIRLHALFKCNY